MTKKEYECKHCGNKVELEAKEADVPECCDTTMQEAEPLPVCEVSETAEHSRAEIWASLAMTAGAARSDPNQDQTQYSKLIMLKNKYVVVIR